MFHGSSPNSSSSCRMAQFMKAYPRQKTLLKSNREAVIKSENERGIEIMRESEIMREIDRKSDREREDDRDTEREREREDNNEREKENDLEGKNGSGCDLKKCVAEERKANLEAMKNTISLDISTLSLSPSLSLLRSQPWVPSQPPDQLALSMPLALPLPLLAHSIITPPVSEKASTSASVVKTETVNNLPCSSIPFPSSSSSSFLSTAVTLIDLNRNRNIDGDRHIFPIIPSARCLRRAKALRRELELAGSLDCVTPLGIRLFCLDVLS